METIEKWKCIENQESISFLTVRPKHWKDRISSLMIPYWPDTNKRQKIIKYVGRHCHQNLNNFTQYPPIQKGYEQNSFLVEIKAGKVISTPAFHNLHQKMFSNVHFPSFYILFLPKYCFVLKKKIFCKILRRVWKNWK